MDGILPRIRFADKEKFFRRMRSCREGGLKTRYLIMSNLLHGRTAKQTADALGVATSTVYRVAGRFRAEGELGLYDRREDNGQTKLDERYLAILYEVVRSNPQEHGWARPTWTREMLVSTMRGRTRVTINVGTMSRALRQIGARRGRPRPRVRCPWGKRAKQRRLALIRKMLATLPQDEVAVYEDEVDIHLNPKIGLDWMARGQQKEVMTPGKNVKRYLAGALDARTGQLTWVEGEQKTSYLFIDLLKQLTEQYPDARAIHVVLDNYSIHSSKITQIALTGFASRIKLHFLPPYCPDDNKIERVWQDLHAEVTRNHRCAKMADLMCRVRRYLRKRNRRTQRQWSSGLAA